MPTFALNFYSPVVADQLRTGRKTATIRLGDKSPKYKKGMIVTVLVGARYGAREKIFDAVIDKVEVKALEDLSPREIEHDNPSIRRPEEMADFLSQLYNRDVSGAHAVTVIRFSAIKNSSSSGCRRSAAAARIAVWRRAPSSSSPGLRCSRSGSSPLARPGKRVPRIGTAEA